MRSNVMTPNLPLSKPGSSQSNQRKRSNTQNYQAPAQQQQQQQQNMTSIDILESDIIQLSHIKKNQWEDNMIKPPSALAKRRNNNFIQNINDGDAYNPIIIQPGQISIKTSRPASLGTTKATQFYLKRRQSHDDHNDTQDLGNEQKISSVRRSSKRTTGMSFYQNDNQKGLSPTKTKLLENVGKINLVEYPNKIEEPTPKVWHPRMEDYENKGSEWLNNIDSFKQEELQKQEERQKQIRESIRKSFHTSFVKNLNINIKQKQNTLYKLHPLGVNSTIGNSTQNKTNCVQTLEKDQSLNVTKLNDTCKVVVDAQPQQIITLSSTLANLQRHPRVNSAATRSHTNQSSIFDELDRFDEMMEENQKMKLIMSKMYHQSKGFCGITKKENEMLSTVDGFKKVRAKKAQPSYPYCLTFDPF